MVSNNTVELERGRDYNIHFLINRKDVGTDIISNNPSSKYKYTLLNGILSIKDYCPTDGGAFTIRYSYNSETSYNNELFIIPKYTQRFTGIKSVINNESLAFNWEKSSDLYEIDYSLTRGNEVYQYVVSTTGKITGEIYSEEIVSKLDKFTSKIGYVEIKIYQIKIQTSQTIETHQFTSSISVDGTYGGGIGTKDEPYLISCERHFRNLIYNRDNLVRFQITGVLTISSPIEYFYGVLGDLDGPQAHVRINYEHYYTSLDNYDEIAMFVYNYGSIYKIQIETDIKVTGGQNTMWAKISAIAAYNYGTITQCGAVFRVESYCSRARIGAMAAYNYGTIDGCFSANYVTSAGYFGGIAAENGSNGVIKNCMVAGTVNLYTVYLDEKYYPTYSGGIVGYNKGKVENCDIGGWDDEVLDFYVKVDYVDTQDLQPYIGPVCGYNENTITNCHKICFNLYTGNLHSYRVWFTTYNQKKNINDYTG